MGAPEYVPVDPSSKVRTYSSPPRRPTPWKADRPGELAGPQPRGSLLGTPGPDQGYALKLARRLADEVKLAEGESEADVLAAGAAIGMKRSGLFSRAPILADVRAGLVPWGFFDPDAPAELLRRRREMFEEVHHAHHYIAMREVVDAVPADLLCQSLDDIEVAYAEDWQACLSF
ncbi:MAG: hypothetical protein ACR2OH_00920 [Microthrixaceae bacterium]